jgi:hypothetical protein
LAALGESPPKSTAAAALRFARDLLGIIVNVYLHDGSRRNAITTPLDCEELEIRFNKGKAQSTTSPRGYVASTLRGVRRLGEIDPSKVEQACGMYAAAAALFAWSGTSFALSARILPISARLTQNLRDELCYRTMHFLHHYLVGNWSPGTAIESDVLDAAQRAGVFWELNTYLGLSCEQRIRQGWFTGARERIDRITVLVEQLGYKFGRTTQLSMSAFLAVEEDRLDDALVAIDRYYEAANEEALNVLALSTRTKILCLRSEHEFEEATKSFREAADLVRRLGSDMAPYHISPFLLSGLLLQTARIEQFLTNGERPPRALVRDARASRDRALRLARKIGRDRPEAWRLAGRLDWLLSHRRRAIANWRTAIREAQRLGARPELARIYDEVAERLTVAGFESFDGRDISSLRAERQALRQELDREVVPGTVATRAA